MQPRGFGSKMASAKPVPLIAVRSSKSFNLKTCSAKSHEDVEAFSKFKAGSCRLFMFSKDGKLFGWCDNIGNVNVISTATCELVMQTRLPKTSCMAFSPRNNILVTWEPYAVNKENPSHANNLRLWNVETGKTVKELNQKKQSSWLPQWSDDENICARNVNNEVHFFENNNFEIIAKKIHIQKVSCFQLSHGPPPHYVLCYVHGTSGQPSFLRLYRYPQVEGTSAAIANKSFFRADKVDIKWNCKGSCVLVIATSDVDKSDSSYYGEQKLHYFDVKGESGMVHLAKQGPVYSVEWHPVGNEFCVVYGYMPAKATLFNLKAEAIFDFGTGPRNSIYYNPQGHLLILAGFGNLRGNIEVWNMKNHQSIVKFLASDSTHLEWGPDGEHLITATTSPRLRVGNGYKLWNYTGQQIFSVEMGPEQFLFDIKWQQFLPGVFLKRDLPTHYVANTAAVAASHSEVYRPPGARGQPSSFKLHEYEKPSNAQQDSNASKAAMKNKKKRDAKKAKKETELNAEHTSTSTSSSSSTSTSTLPDILGDMDNATLASTGDSDRDNKIKNLLKKITQINKLKMDVAAGKRLELNQLEKIKKESELVDELKKLQLC